MNLHLLLTVQNTGHTVDIISEVMGIIMCTCVALKTWKKEEYKSLQCLQSF